MRKFAALLGLLVFALVATGCINDLKPEGGWSSPTEIDGNIYVGNKDGKVVRFDTDANVLSGSFEYPAGDGLGSIYGTVKQVRNVVYGTGYDCTGDSCSGEVFAVSLDSGNSVWGQDGYELNTKLVGDVGISGSTILVATSAINDEADGASGYLYALDATPGSSSILKWRLPLDGDAWTGVAVDGTTAYVGTLAGTLYAVDVSDSDSFTGDPESRILWTWKDDHSLASGIHAEGGLVYFGTLGNKVYKFDSDYRKTADPTSSFNNSRGEWEYDAGAWIWAKPVVEGDTVYVAAVDGSVHSVDQATGNENWSTKIEGQIVAAPALFDRQRGDITERALAVPSGEKHVQVVSVIDGRELGVFVTDERVKTTPLVSGDHLYVHTLNGDLKWYSLADTNQRGCVNLKDGARCD
ncbi:MAG: PQQ-binding-like beta-propeller repeat protein [Dehalococcoidia bacterium]